MPWALLGVVVCVGGLGLVLAGRSRRRMLAPVQEAVAGRPIAELTDGRFRVCGRVAGPRATPSAIDGMPCVYIERAEYAAFGSALVPVMRETERRCISHMFYLEDDTGRLLLDPRELAIDAATLHGEEGFMTERRLRVGEEVCLIASFKPSAFVHGDGPYRAGTTAWEPAVDAYGPPQLTYRTEREMVVAVDEVTQFLQTSGWALLVMGAVAAIAGLS